MNQVEFNYNGQITIIQCNQDEKMKDICERFATKVGIDINTIYFLYSSEQLNKEKTFDQCINKEDKERNKMNILVYDFQNNNENSDKLFIKSKDIICPECGETGKINVNNYKISIYCNNNHKIDNILLNEYENTQNIDQSKIICDKCKENNKKDAFNNVFFKCNSCNMNLCPLCKKGHENHNPINYEQKNYICKFHNESYISYCKTCKINMCMLCENMHKEHEILYYGKILPDITNLKNKMNKLKNKIDKFECEIKKIIEIFNKVLENMKIFYKIYNDNINNIDIKNRNYEIIYNIKEIYNKDIIKDMDNIINDKNINNKIKNILDIYNKMNYKGDIDQIKIRYKINNKDKIRIFGNDFVRNNKNNCTIIFEGKEYELQEFFNVKNLNKNILEIHLKGIKKVTNMNDIFDKCSLLLSLPDISEWNTSNIKSMYQIFDSCTSLKSLPDISKWNTSNVTNMGLMFYGCSSLTDLPDISKWDTSKVTDMHQMFDGCTSLKSLPDISKWNMSNVTNLSWMFCDCLSLSSLPDISKWDTKSINNINYMFKGCNKSLIIPSKFSR